VASVTGSSDAEGRTADGALYRLERPGNANVYNPLDICGLAMAPGTEGNLWSIKLLDSRLDSRISFFSSFLLKSPLSFDELACSTQTCLDALRKGRMRGVYDQHGFDRCRTQS
jgi:hypothetical protein